MALAAITRDRCKYYEVDFKRSTAGCLKLKTDVAGSMYCHTAVTPPLCLPPHLARELSPGHLARALGDLGPLLVWLPLLGFTALHSYAHRDEQDHHSQTRHHMRSAVTLAALGYIATIMPVRFVRRALQSGFDPSGHILLFGVQLVPLWAAAEVLSHASMQPLAVAVGSRAAGRRWKSVARLASWCLLGVEIILIALTVATAAWFHHASEVAAAWVLIAGLVWATHAQLVRMRQVPGTSPKHASLKRWWKAALAAWVAGLAMPLALLSQPSSGIRTEALVGAVGYDLAVLVMAWFLLSGGQPASGAHHRPQPDEMKRKSDAVPSAAGESASPLTKAGPALVEEPTLEQGLASSDAACALDQSAQVRDSNSKNR